jgi:putative copper resistance protein D
MDLLDSGAGGLHTPSFMTPIRIAFCLLLMWSSSLPAAVPDAHHHAGAASDQKWEGSPEGKAYSERNHHLAGVLVLAIGASELLSVLGRGAARSRFVLPAAMLVAGTFLMIWSDHEAWPVGRLSFADTFLGGDWEMVQHKLYGVLLLAVGLTEWQRRAGRLRHALWGAALPVFAIVGGVMLFAHSHGAHPAAAKIAFHHTIMGILAIGAGACRLTRQAASGPALRSSSEVGWAVLVLLIGLDLVFYSE